MDEKQSGGGCLAFFAALVVLGLVIMAVMWVLSLPGHALGLTPTYHEVMNRDEQWLHRHYPNVGWRYVVTALLLIATGVAAYVGILAHRANPEAWRSIRWTHAVMGLGVVVVLFVGIRASIGTPTGSAPPEVAAVTASSASNEDGTSDSVEPTFDDAKALVADDSYSDAVEAASGLSTLQQRNLERVISRRLAARASFALAQDNRKRAAYLLSAAGSYLSTPQYRRAKRRLSRATARARARRQRAVSAAAAPRPEPDTSSACDPNYSGGCVPSDQGDVDCPDIPATDLQVVGSDVYGLDRDSDGVACQS